MTRYDCPICEGIGKLRSDGKSHRGLDTILECTCWACNGSGKISFDPESSAGVSLNTVELIKQSVFNRVPVTQRIV